MKEAGGLRATAIRRPLNRDDATAIIYARRWGRPSSSAGQTVQAAPAACRAKTQRVVWRTSCGTLGNALLMVRLHDERKPRNHR